MAYLLSISRLHQFTAQRTHGTSGTMPHSSEMTIAKRHNLKQTYR